MLKKHDDIAIRRVRLLIDGVDRDMRSHAILLATRIEQSYIMRIALPLCDKCGSDTYSYPIEN